MSEDEWNRIIRSVKQGQLGPWTCPECDEYAVELGQRFAQGHVVERTLLCFACQAKVAAPA
ncbi:hypothetical protein [Actinomadura decatromicini]|uniref:Uncharacterized protein n=1 Tax=Actinomadura decatromicini TaxID=2604572 RepID=A0A5D3FY21_9ACTN|nr:hypothetical protein [Actinomadura decatromicini]TYK52816.1 hypothetical protein FXF68_03420 [Actinomadura decatromicini]